MRVQVDVILYEDGKAAGRTMERFRAPSVADAIREAVPGADKLAPGVVEAIVADFAAGEPVQGVNRGVIFGELQAEWSVKVLDEDDEPLFDSVAWERATTEEP